MRFISMACDSVLEEPLGHTKNQQVGLLSKTSVKPMNNIEKLLSSLYLDKLY